MKTFLFHGYPGSGKDTQVNLLVERYGFENIGTGEMIRYMYKHGDIQAIRANEDSLKGHLVPNEIIYSMLNKYILKFDSEKNWAFVSVVREKGQIPLFDNLLDTTGRKLDSFIHFTLTPEISIERISLRSICPHCDETYHDKYKAEKVKGYCDRCGSKLTKRGDDSKEKVLVRHKEYERTIAPILDEYRKRDLLVEIDATPGIEEIHRVLVERLGL